MTYHKNVHEVVEMAEMWLLWLYINQTLVMKQDLGNIILNNFCFPYLPLFINKENVSWFCINSFSYEIY